jgi:chromosome segregation ATPase
MCVQASLETEARGRAELLRLKKKLEADLNELEIGLDHANKANMDAQKNLRVAQDHIKDLQLQLEDEIRIKNEVRGNRQLIAKRVNVLQERDRYITAERRAQLLQSEKDELMTNLDMAQRARKQAESEAQDAIHTANDLSSQNAQLSSHTRRLEAELHGIHVSHLFRARVHALYLCRAN